MINHADYFQWLEGSWIRNSVRALIFDAGRQRILVEHHHGLNAPYYNFIGGGLEVGETMIDCLTREIIEETNAHVTAATFVFTVENFFQIEGKPLHALGHYFDVTLDRENVLPTIDGVAYHWVPLYHLDTVDLRPIKVRDCLQNGRYRTIFHLINKEW